MRSQIRYRIRSQTRNSWVTFLLRCFYQRFGWEFYSWGIPQPDDFISVFWQLPKVHKKWLFISAARDKHHNFGFCAVVSACDRFPPLKWPKEMYFCWYLSVAIPCLEMSLAEINLIQYLNYFLLVELDTQSANMNFQWCWTAKYLSTRRRLWVSSLHPSCLQQAMWP